MSSETNCVWEGQFLRMCQRGTWEYVDRKGASGVVGIIAVTEAKALVLVEQYRPPVDTRMIELPAGLAGDTPEFAGEPLVEAAKRELREETGYEAAHWRPAYSGLTSGGLTDEFIELFYASGLERVAAGGGDEHEDIVVHTIPLEGVEDWLAAQSQQGKGIDLKVYGALYYAKQQW